MGEKEETVKANLATATALCRTINEFSHRYGCHVALTGGCLYKDGDRKDLDLLFYRVRQADKISQKGLFRALEGIGLEKPEGFGWLFKSKYKGVPVDLFFPEEQGGEYPEEKEEDR